MDAKIYICLQTQTSCEMETGVDNYVAAVATAVTVDRRCKQRIKNIDQLALILGLLDEE